VSPQPAREILEKLDELHASATPMWIFDQRSLAFLEVNEAAIRQYGYSRSQFLKMTILDIRPFNDVSKVLQNAVRGRAASGEIWTHRRKNRSVFLVRISSRLVSFRGQDAELVSAEEMAARSCEQESATTQL
jgi:PAS domain S-box-containing protein